MFITRVFIANFFVLVANLIFMLSLLPQIFLNYRIKSTKGLSDIFILASLNGQFSYLVYAFIKDLPFIYKIINPIYAFLLSIIIFQRFYYSDKSLNDKKILRIYLLNIFILFSIAFFIFTGLTNLGYLLGWIPVGIGLWKKVPQMFKVYKAKSVYGFSLFFIVLSLLSYTFETSAGLILNLPAPVLFNDLRGFFVNLVFLMQFWVYK
ncbi:hypothetical protein GF385_00515 [Candidatus Dependentiae bacterium]|nr:hypothetical protein [Candidatus Dependentiae bacterium]